MKFLQLGGFSYIYGLFMEHQAMVEQGDMNKFQKYFLGFMLKILRTFITAAFSANDPSMMNIIEFVRRQSSAQEEAKPTQTPKMDKQESVTSDDLYKTPPNKKTTSTTMEQLAEVFHAYDPYTDPYGTGAEENKETKDANPSQLEKKASQRQDKQFMELSQ